jgi:hypothetical protein
VTSRVVDIFIKGKDESSTAWKRAAQWATSFDASIKSNIKTLRDLSIIGVGAAKAIRFLNQTFKFSVEAAGKQLEAETRLAVSLGRVTKEIDSQLKVYRSWAGTIQVATGIEDDLTLSMAATLQATGAMPETVRRATMALVDYSEATGRSVNEAMEPMRRALGGQQAQWSRLGIEVDKSLAPQEQALQVIGDLEQRYGGAAHAIGETAYGSIQRFKAAVGDLKEMLGFAILKTDSFNNVLDVLGFQLGEIDQEARTNQLAGMLDGLFKGVMSGARLAILGLMRFGATVLFFLESLNLGIASVVRGIGDLAKAVEGSSALKALGFSLEGVGDGLHVAADSLDGFGDKIRESSAWLNDATDSVNKFFDALTKTNERAQNMRQGGAGMDGLGKFGANPLPEPTDETALAESFALPTQGLSDFEAALDSLWIKWSAFQFAGLTFASEMSGAFFAISDSAANSVGTLLVDLREKAISGGEAVRKMGNTIANQALASMGRAITKVILAPIDLALNKFTELVTNLIWGAAVEKALQAEAAATALAIGIPTAAALAAAWLPAATFAAIATLGSAAAAGSAGVLSALAATKAAGLAAAIPGAAEGAFVSGPSLLQVGEGRYPETVQPLRPGSAMELLSKSNSAAEFFGGGSPSIGSLTLNIQGGTDNPEKLAKLVSEAIANELRLLAGRRFA